MGCCFRLSGESKMSRVRRMYNGLSGTSVYNSLHRTELEKSIGLDITEFEEWCYENSAPYGDEPVSFVNIARFFGDKPSDMNDFILLPSSMSRTISGVSKRKGGQYLFVGEPESGQMFRVSFKNSKQEYFSDPLDCHLMGLKDFRRRVKEAADIHAKGERCIARLNELVDWLDFHIENRIAYTPLTTGKYLY